MEGGKRGSLADRKAVVRRPADGEEDIGCFADPGEGCCGEAALVEFFPQAGAVPARRNLALEAEHFVPAS